MRVKTPNHLWCDCLINPSPGNGFCDVWTWTPGISRVLKHIATKFLRLHLYVFGEKLSSSGTADVMGRRCVLEIQDGSQITGSTNISETMTLWHTSSNILTANLRHSAMANSQEVHPGDSYNDRQSEMVAQTVYVCMYTSGFDRHLDFHNEWVVSRHSFDMIHLLCHVRKQ